MDLLGSIMGKMEKRSERPKPTTEQQAAIDRRKKLIEREREKKKFMKQKIEERIKRFVAEVERQQRQIDESDDPEVVERLPDLLKVNFKPMDDLWRATGKSGEKSFQLG